MVKIVHFADLHFGMSYDRTDPATGVSIRHADFSKSLDSVINTAIECNADLLIFAGDAYKTRNPSPSYQREFARRIGRLSAAGLPTILLTGNHDTPNSAGSAHAMAIFETLEIPGIHVISKPTVLEIETRHGRVQVGALPWVTRSNLLTQERYKNKNHEDVNRILLGHIETIMDDLATRLKPGVPHILVAHGTVQGAVYGSERNVMLGSDITLPLSLFKNESWDYVALGHIHRHQALEDDRYPPVVYSGSIERIDFGEEKEDKGFIIAEVGRSECTWKFQRLDTRRFVTIRVEADGINPMSHVIRAIEHAPFRDAVVRVIIQVTADRNALLAEKEIRNALKGAHYIKAIIRNVIRPERMRIVDREDLLAMSPIDVMRMYLESGQTEPERIDLLVRHAEGMNIE